jgi:UDP-glucose 4-epimerase
VLPDILAQVREGGALRLGNLDARRDYVHARDVADALVRLAAYDGVETVFNVGTGVGTSVRELVPPSARCSTLAPHRTRTRRRCGPSSACTSSRTRRGRRQELGWTPRLTLHDGLRDLVAHELAAVA